jgi:hypothetical protein
MMPMAVFGLKTSFATTSGITDENESVKATLITILHEAYKLNPDFITNSNGYNITTELGFPKSWGLGTSSTLINNIAQWLQIDAFTLLKTVLAVAVMTSPARKMTPYCIPFGSRRSFY